MKRLLSLLALGVFSAPLYAQLPVTTNTNQQALLASDNPTLAANKKLVFDFWREVFQTHDMTSAPKYMAEDYKQHMEPVLLQARDVGAAIVDEATERDADLLVVGLPYRTRFGGDFAIGRTIPYILQNAPCTVWVVREPMSEEPS